MATVAPPAARSRALLLGLGRVADLFRAKTAPPRGCEEPDGRLSSDDDLSAPLTEDDASESGSEWLDAYAESTSWVSRDSLPLSVHGGSSLEEARTLLEEIQNLRSPLITDSPFLHYPSFRDHVHQDEDPELPAIESWLASASHFS